MDEFSLEVGWRGALLIKAGWILIVFWNVPRLAKGYGERLVRLSKKSCWWTKINKGLKAWLIRGWAKTGWRLVLF
jgi:hypothetical protein